MKSPATLIITGLSVLAALIIVPSTLYTVHETEQVIITQFGKPIGEAVTNAGLHIKMPFVQDVNQLDKRILPWDGMPSEISTKDKTFIIVDAFGRWRIRDGRQFFLRLRDLRSANSRLNNILGSEIRNAIAKHQLIEVVRTTKGRKPVQDETLTGTETNLANWVEITTGRSKVEAEIYKNAAPKLVEFGIELLDLRFKRINYNERVRKEIYDRMITEREQIASRFRSEGEEEAAKINGNRDKDLQEIESTAYRRIQEIEGEADAKATEIYANAYNQSPEAAKFYEFVQTMDTYKSVLTQDSTMILTTDSELFRFLKATDSVTASPKK